MRAKVLTAILLLVHYWALAQAPIESDIKIDNGSSVTSNVEGKVRLQIYSRGAVQMQISEESNFTGARWMPYETTVVWKLSQGDGLKTVYAKFKDKNGEITTAEAKIELDREPPTETSISLNMGATYTNDKNRMITIDFTANDASQMQLSTRSDFAGTMWMPYRPQMRYQFKDNVDGKKTLFARFKDNAGNVSQPVMASIILDRIPPTNPKVLINGGDDFSKTNEVTLTLYAEGATAMIFRGENDWIPYQTTYKYTLLPEGDGERAVQVIFRDSVGNQTRPVTDAITVDSDPPQAPKVSINGGNRNTKDGHVNLKMSAIGASEMMVSNDESFNGATWIAYNTMLPSWNLPEGEGEKKVFVKFRDKVGNESEIAFAKINLDKTPPLNPKIEIDGKTKTNDKSGKVNLKLSAEGAKYMMLSNESSFYGARWEIYKTEVKEWELGGKQEDGNKGVYVKYRDEAGNVTQPVYAVLKLDTRGPVDCKLMIDMNKDYTTNKDGKVTLNLFARGAYKMLISNSSSFEGDSTLVPYNTSYEWKLEGDDGLKSVAVRFVDDAGNWSETVVDNIILDRKPPFDAELIVNKGDSVTSDPDGIVLIRVRAKEAVMMRIANTEDFQGEQWQKYDEHNRGWKLSAGPDGKRKVYVKFKDQADNETPVIAQEIFLDRTPPKKGFVKIMAENQAQAKSQTVKLSLKADGATEMQVSNFFDFRDAKWEVYQPEKEWTLTSQDGIKMVFARFKDKVGNVSLPAYDKIGLDTQAPTNGKILINNGAKFCTNVNRFVTLKLSVREATQMMIANTADFKDAQWQKYEMYVPNWRLEDGDGEKSVFVKFKDNAGNETQPITATIILDRQEPVGESVVINDGEPCTNTKTNRVKLSLSAEGATEMAFSSNTYFNNVKWEPYKENKDYTLTGGRDGMKSVYVKFRDEAGNESGVAKGTILHDTEAPYTGTLKINGGKTLTNETSIRLTLNAKGAELMRVSNSPTFDDGTDWEPYTTQRAWALKDGAGLKTVYVKFKDKCGNESAPIQQTITLAY